eukprot:3544419-Heterocapsa_arctica.AAC.1
MVRQWRQLSAPRAYPSILDGEDDRTKWPELLTTHFKKVVNTLGCEHQNCRSQLEQRVQEAHLAYVRSPSLSVVITLSDLQTAVNKLKRGKTTAEDR